MIELSLTYPEKNQTFEIVELYKDDEYIGMIMIHDTEAMVDMVNILRSHYRLKRIYRNKILG